MSMRGSCSCNNIQVVWHTVDYSVVPRACECEYCLTKGAAYVSKSGTAVDVLVHKERQHRIIMHGSRNARFHECSGCGDLVFVTATIDGTNYGVLNAMCMKNKLGFPAAVMADVSGQTAEQKRDRWRQNWCFPVSISPGSEVLTALPPIKSSPLESM